jgi:phospholipid transport system substrate-binding protein
MTTPCDIVLARNPERVPDLPRGSSGGQAACAPTRSRRRRLLFAVAAGGLFLIGAAPPTWAAPAAAERTESLIATFKKVKSGVKLTAADKKANEAVFAEIDKFMDFEALTTSPIEPRAAKFSAKQKAEFATKFKDLIRAIAYPDSGTFFRDAKMKIGAPAEKAGATVVPVDASVPKDDLRTKLEFFWAQSKGGGGTLKIADVAFDGDSLIKDYQNQFARIIDKEGVAGLLKKLDEKKAELDKGNGKEARAAK